MMSLLARPMRALAPCGLGLALLAGCGEAPMTPPSSSHDPNVVIRPGAAAAPSEVQGEPPGTFPPLPGGNMTDVGPDRPEPFSNRSYSNIVTEVEEAPTGRLQFGTQSVPYKGLPHPDAAIERADAAVDSAVRRVDSTVDRALDRTNTAVDRALGRAEHALERADGTVRKVGGALKTIGESLEQSEPSRP
jgi:hypothetical protein